MSRRTGVGVISLALAVAGCGSGAIGGDSDADANDDDADAVCGNGLVEATEECDDANSIDGDGCNVDCLKSGVVRWCVEYAHPGGADGMSAGVAVGPDGVLVAGWGGLSNDPSTTFKSWVMDVEFDGSSASNELVPVDGDAEVSVGGIAVSPNGDAIFVGYLEQPELPGSAWVGTRSESGTFSSQTYSDPDGTIALSVFYGANGPIVVGAVGKLGWVAQLNGALQIVWEDRFSILGIEEDATDVVEHADGSIMVVGRSRTDLTSELHHAPIFHSFVRTYSPDRAEVTNQIISEGGDQSWVLSAIATSASRTVAGGNAYIDIAGVGYAWSITSDTSQIAPAPSGAAISLVHDVALGSAGDTYLVGAEFDGSALVEKIWYFPDIGSGEAGWELTRGAGEVLSVVTAGSYLYTASVLPVGGQKVAEVCAVSR
ncbi:hypothetical protein [Enhygromyxa salina]|nr:hypothetical protein [Enhygromyxa salina]